MEKQDYSNGLRYQSWEDVVDLNDEREMRLVASRLVNSPYIPDELRQELEELYPKQDENGEALWEGLWEYEAMGSELFDRVVQIAAHGSFSIEEVSEASTSKEKLEQLWGDVHELSRRKKAADRLRQLRIAERTL